MPETSAGPAPDAAPSPPLGVTAGSHRKMYRSTTDRYLAGVCGGIAEHLGVSAALVRAVFLVAALAGAGVMVYAFVWALTPLDTEAPEAAQAAARPAPRRKLTGGQLLLVAGGVLLISGLGLAWPLAAISNHLGVIVPVMAVTAGAFIAWSRLDDPDRGRWGGPSSHAILSVGRPLIGVALATVGVIALATMGKGLTEIWNSALAAFAVLLGAMVIVAPWVIRLWQRLQREQAERARATERADITAHLHDSVLQTLALIQRRADDPQTVQRLARSQERELRAWLYAGQRGSGDSLATAVTAAAHEVEDEHGVPIDLVITGDRPLDPGGIALAKAAREAMLNAVRHGAPPVSAYVEAGPAGVEAFIRDHGDGFEMAEIAADRLGVRESILGRMSRHGGTAKVRRLEQGTEIELTLPPAGEPGATEVKGESA